VVVEEVTPDDLFDAEYRTVSFADWAGREAFEHTMRSYGVWPRCSLVVDGERTHGMSVADLEAFAADADLLLAVGAHVSMPALLEGPRVTAYVDEAPGKTQAYHYEYGVGGDLDRFDHLFTVGLLVGTELCDVPTGGRRWHPIVHPVVLDDWPVAEPPPDAPWTTVSNWGTKESFFLHGVYSGQKSDGWREVLDIPARSELPFRVALGVPAGYERDRSLFSDAGWDVVDGRALTTLGRYRGFVAASRGEFSAANRRYVRFHTGWTSDRTARYLACGRPAVVESTGAEHALPLGKGLLTFTGADEAVEGLTAVEADYEGHRRAARELAEEYFDARKVLTGVLEVAGLA
jgi:hypothetical protein